MGMLDRFFGKRLELHETKVNIGVFRGSKS